MANIMTIVPIWINARFLQRPITGVERVAREVIDQLASRADAQGQLRLGEKVVQLRLIAPGGKSLENPWPNIPLEYQGKLRGHLWEQTELAARTAGQWLLNLCNTAPLFKRKQWVFLHDAQPFAIPGNFTPYLRLWYQILYRVTGRLSRVIFTNSHFSASELQRYAGIPGRKIQVMHLGADHIARSQPEHSLRLEQLWQQMAQPFVLAVSSNNPNKNFNAVVRALEMLGTSAPICVIVGGQNDRVFSRQQVQSGKLVQIGYVSDGELVALYQKASLLLYPSHYEGFGLPPLEAMWLGCPVIAANTAALPEVLGDAAMYCTPTDPATLAERIQHFMAHPQEREAWQRHVRQHARQYRWQLAVDLLICRIQDSISDSPKA